VMDEATYAKSVQYTLANSRFSQFEATFDLVVLLVVLFSGVLPARFRRVLPALSKPRAAMTAQPRIASPSSRVLPALLYPVPRIPFSALPHPVNLRQHCALVSTRNGAPVRGLAVGTRSRRAGALPSPRLHRDRRDTDRRVRPVVGDCMTRSPSSTLMPSSSLPVHPRGPSAPAGPVNTQ